MAVDTISTARRWSMLVIALFATLSANVFINGVAFLIPTLHKTMGLDLARAGLISAMPSFGMVLTLIAWGYVVDRVGERFVLSVGSALTAAAAFAAASMHSLILMGAFLLLGGMAAASSNSASGRLVVGWFPAAAARSGDGHPPDRAAAGRGLRRAGDPAAGADAMASGWRCCSRRWCAPRRRWCARSGCSTRRARRAPRRPPSTWPTPTAGRDVLWRIHAVSVLLVVPQCVVWTFSLVWLIVDRGWSPESAGVLVMAAQVLGALGRIAAGRWSDRMRARLRPIRMIAVAAGLSMLVLAITDAVHSPLSIAVMVVASVITVSDNGLAFTAIAEIAGPFWSGRALGTQNTSQLLTAGLTPPLFGALIGVLGYPVAFAVCALFPSGRTAAGAGRSAGRQEA